MPSVNSHGEPSAPREGTAQGLFRPVRTDFEQKDAKVTKVRTNDLTAEHIGMSSSIYKDVFTTEITEVTE